MSEYGLRAEMSTDHFLISAEKIMADIIGRKSRIALLCAGRTPTQPHLHNFMGENFEVTIKEVMNVFLVHYL